MCGRYAGSRDAAALVEVLADLGVEVTEVDDGARAAAPSWNVAPTTVRPVLTARSGGIRLAGLSWGLVPSWAKDRRGAARMINARVESAAERPAYRSLLGRRRCLVPADGWFEWRSGAGGKQPWFVHPGPDAPPVLLLAGLYSWWRDTTVGVDPETGEPPWFGSYTILTGPARADLTWLHDRMPVVVAADAWRDWLSPGAPVAAGPGPAAEDLVADLVAALRSDLATGRHELAWHPVDRRVGAVAHDDPGLVEPVPVPPE
ncbi:MAG: SOS response-associated peptidase [Kineosporiaceae bacterium]